MISQVQRQHPNSFSELNTNTSTAQIQPKTKIPQTLAEIYTPQHFYLSHLHIVHRHTSTPDKLGMQNELPLHAKTWPKALSHSLSLSLILPISLSLTPFISFNYQGVTNWRKLMFPLASHPG